jgi:hypothetical protein
MQALRASGAILSLQIFKDRPHEICDQEIVLARQTLAKAVV